ncbi:LON peptidase substrate-binding domain-containing protein [uncultured Desulfosarcina sp.]|uniref:LON peptidase substrate-binding domain-containing protein n=1 Tax=uncultured Desulfosarcina sp. TaxID=218289 RepID=UPI0029C62E18|nr:LON peptidase substrate-binding domain-containing protein [uncultured Desulfosarcina sp.]
MTETVKIPIFPLGVVLLPDMLLPLHIFEERYKQMIFECLTEQRPFGIVLFDGQSIRSVGCMARIIEIVKRYDDGRMDILTRGGERFVIRGLIQDRAYMEARVFFFDDEQEEASDDQSKEVVESALNLLKEDPDIHLGVDPPNPGDRIHPKTLSYVIAALEGFAPAERQDFLEMTSSTERLKKCVQALSRIVARNRLTREIRKMIGGNGHPPKSILRELQGLEKK